MIRIEKNKEYEFRLLPNKFNPGHDVIEVMFTDPKYNSPYLAKHYYCYVLNQDNKAQIFKFGVSVKKYLEYTRRGFYGTSDGFFISSGEGPEFYFSNDDKSLIFLKDETYISVQSDFKKYDDVLLYEPFLLNNVQSKYLLTLKTREKHGCLDIYNIGLKKVEPLYKPGDDKEKILSMYDGVEKLEDFVDNFKRNNSNKFVFDSAAQQLYKKRLQIKNSNSEVQWYDSL